MQPGKKMAKPPSSEVGSPDNGRKGRLGVRRSSGALSQRLGPLLRMPGSSASLFPSRFESQQMQSSYDSQMLEKAAVVVQHAWRTKRYLYVEFGAEMFLDARASPSSGRILFTSTSQVASWLTVHHLSSTWRLANFFAINWQLPFPEFVVSALGSSVRSIARFDPLRVFCHVGSVVLRPHLCSAGPQKASTCTQHCNTRSSAASPPPWRLHRRGSSPMARMPALRGFWAMFFTNVRPGQNPQPLSAHPPQPQAHTQNPPTATTPKQHTLARETFQSVRMCGPADLSSPPGRARDFQIR